MKKLNFLTVTASIILIASFFSCNKLATVTIMGESSVSEITDTSATVKGTILEIGENMQKYGHVWGENENPTTSNFSSEHTEAAETFSDKLTNLIPETKYYIRPYAKDGDEIVYEQGTEFMTIASPDPALISTYNVSDLSYTTVTCGGNITDEGESPVTQRGVCWSTSENPTIMDLKTIDGNGPGEFTSNVTGLDNNTTYYIRAYAVNTEDIYYGQQESFTTLKILPTVTTDDVSAVAYNTATCGGKVTYEGMSTVTERGICWSITPSPTITDNSMVSGIGTGTFQSIMTDLTEGDTYYVRAFAKNTEGTSYGEEKNFTTQSFAGTVTDYDGNVYNTVQIGDQIWMAENLKVTHYSDGTALIDGTGLGAIGQDDMTKYYFDYNDDSGNISDYGKLYSWGAIMNDSEYNNNIPSGVQGVCPLGWHIPSIAEWDILTTYLEGSDLAGGKLKETGTDHWNNPNTGATNITGFSAVAGGLRHSSGFLNIKKYAFFWSSSLHNNSPRTYKIIQLNYDNDNTSKTDYYTSWGMSVRCLKD